MGKRLCRGVPKVSTYTIEDDEKIILTEEHENENELYPGKASLTAIVGPNEADQQLLFVPKKMKQDSDKWPGFKHNPPLPDGVSSLDIASAFITARQYETDYQYCQGEQFLQHQFLYISPETIRTKLKSDAETQMQIQRIDIEGDPDDFTFGEYRRTNDETTGLFKIEVHFSIVGEEKIMQIFTPRIFYGFDNANFNWQFCGPQMNSELMRAEKEVGRSNFSGGKIVKKIDEKKEISEVIEEVK